MCIVSKHLTSTDGGLPSVIPRKTEHIKQAKNNSVELNLSCSTKPHQVNFLGNKRRQGQLFDQLMPPFVRLLVFMFSKGEWVLIGRFVWPVLTLGTSGVSLTQLLINNRPLHSLLLWPSLRWTAGLVNNWPDQYLSLQFSEPRQYKNTSAVYFLVFILSQLACSGDVHVQYVSLYRSEGNRGRVCSFTLEFYGTIGHVTSQIQLKNWRIYYFGWLKKGSSERWCMTVLMHWLEPVVLLSSICIKV